MMNIDNIHDDHNSCKPYYCDQNKVKNAILCNIS